MCIFPVGFEAHLLRPCQTMCLPSGLANATKIPLGRLCCQLLRDHIIMFDKQILADMRLRASEKADELFLAHNKT